MFENISHTKTKIGSERGFGYVFAIAFLIIGFLPLFNNNNIRLWAIFISLVFFALAFWAPKKLTLMNKLWFKIGIILGAIISPIVMGIIFFLTVVTTGYIMKLLGKDILNMKIIKSKKSYWIKKESKNFESMKNQF